MGRHDWYRNTKWNDEIADAYFTKLSRASSKDQYLACQAGCLQERYPRIALDLIDQFFTLPKPFDPASAYLIRAKAYLSLGDDQRAIDAFEAAIAEEERNPNIKTTAWSEYGLYAIRRHRADLYRRTAEIARNIESEGPLLLSTERFSFWAILAVEADHHGKRLQACGYARHALETAGETKSVFRYHRNTGLVDDRYSDVVRLMRRIADGPWYRRLFAKR